MKVTVNIDCTPLEARQFFGLPDVQPMQQAVMAEMEKKMLNEIQTFTPEKMMNSWLSLAPQNADWFRSLFDQFTTMGGATATKKE